MRFLASTAAALLLVGCGGAGSDDPRVLHVWAHAGRESERTVLTDQVRRYNARGGDGPRVEMTFLPEGSYNAQVQAAAVAGDLPDVLEFDGPFVYGYAWQGRLRSLDSLLSDEVLDDLLPSIVEQGKYRDKMWAVGTFDSGLGLWGRRSALAAIGARIPDSPGVAWSAEELDAILTALAAVDPDGAVLDLKLNYAGEWYTYGFSPLLQSAGGDLIDRDGFERASGVLDGPDSVRAMETIQAWIRRGLVDPNIDDASFVARRVPLSLGGHWNWAGYSEAFGDDLVLLPLPDLGRGSRTGQGSWAWGVTRNCARPRAAAEFLEFLLRPEEVLAMADANGGVPATRSAVEQSELYGPGGPLRLFAEQLAEGWAVPRPRTPAYGVITAAFQAAFDRIRSGGDVTRALGRAAREIDLEIVDNRGYPWVVEAAESR